MGKMDEKYFWCEIVNKIFVSHHHLMPYMPYFLIYVCYILHNDYLIDGCV